MDQPQPHTTTRELRMCITRPCLACTWRRRGRYLADAPSRGPAVWCADAPTRLRALFEWRLQQGAPAESSPPPGHVELKPSAHAIDDADRLVDLLRVDAQRRGQADDVAWKWYVKSNVWSGKTGKTDKTAPCTNFGKSLKRGATQPRRQTEGAGLMCQQARFAPVTPPPLSSDARTPPAHREWA